MARKIIGEYRDISWYSERDLSIKLGKRPEYINQIRRHHPDRSYEEIIDRVLDPYIYEYRGIRWKNDSDLSIKLNKQSSYVRSYIYRGKTHEQIIDNVLDRTFCNVDERYNHGTYRGITWTSDRDLSRKLGKYQDYVYLTCKRKHITREQVIDMVLSKRNNVGKD